MAQKLEETKLNVTYGVTADGRVAMQFGKPIDNFIMTPDEVKATIGQLQEGLKHIESMKKPSTH